MRPPTRFTRLSRKWLAALPVALILHLESATIAPLPEVAHFLTGTQGECEIVDVASAKRVELRVYTHLKRAGDVRRAHGADPRPSVLARASGCKARDPLA